MANVHMIVERNFGVVSVYSSMKKAASALNFLESTLTQAGWTHEGTVICLGDGSYTRYCNGDAYRDYRIDTYEVE